MLQLVEAGFMSQQHRCWYARTIPMLGMHSMTGEIQSAEQQLLFCVPGARAASPTRQSLACGFTLQPNTNANIQSGDWTTALLALRCSLLSMTRGCMVLLMFA